MGQIGVCSCSRWGCGGVSLSMWEAGPKSTQKIPMSSWYICPSLSQRVSLKYIHHKACISFYQAQTSASKRVSKLPLSSCVHPPEPTMHIIYSPIFTKFVNVPLIFIQFMVFLLTFFGFHPISTMMHLCPCLCPKSFQSRESCTSKSDTNTLRIDRWILRKWSDPQIDHICELVSLGHYPRDNSPEKNASGVV